MEMLPCNCVSAAGTPLSSLSPTARSEFLNQISHNNAHVVCTTNGEHADHRRLGMVPVVDGDGDQNKEKELSSNHFYSPKKTTDKIR